MSALAIETATEVVDTSESDVVKALDRQLLIDSRRYASEQLGRSWWHFGTTLVAVAVSALVAGLAEPTWLRLLASLMTGLTLVRFFIVYHDFQHQAMFKNSRLAHVILSIYVFLMITPPSVW